MFFDKKTQKHGISAKLFVQSIAFLDFCVITENEMNLLKNIVRGTGQNHKVPICAFLEHA